MKYLYAYGHENLIEFAGKTTNKKIMSISRLYCTNPTIRSVYATTDDNVVEVITPSNTEHGEISNLVTLSDFEEMYPDDKFKKELLNN
jgi:hypothetical protein